MADSIFKVKEKSIETINTDSFDRDVYKQMREAAIALQTTEKVGIESLNTFAPLLQDVFSSLYKYAPEVKSESEIKSSHKLNHTLIKKAIETDQYQQLRTYTRMDEVNSALATITIANNLTDTIKEQLKAEAEQAKQIEEAEDEAQKAQEQADGLIQVAGMAKGAKKKTLTADAKEATEKAKEKVAVVKQLADKQTEDLKTACQTIRNAMRGAQDKAIEDIKEMDEVMESFGSEAGSMQLMPPEKRLALAQQLSQNKKLKALALLIGRFKRIAVAKQKTKVIQSQEEVYDIELGSNLSRIIPSELALLNNPLTKLEFKRRMVEGELMQYALKGSETVGKGAIIVCVDNSSSMDGERSDWAKAVTLALLEVAWMQKRSYANINFGSKKDPLDVTEILKTDKNIMESVIHIASYQLVNGGTDFEIALGKAVEIIEKDAFKKGDMVFITDGAAEVSPEFLKTFLEVKKRKEFKCQGIEIMGSSEELKKFCDTTTRLHEFGIVEAGEIFGGI